MRLREFTEDRALPALLSVLEYLHSKKDKQPVVNTQSLIAMVKNTGVPFSYDLLVDLFDSNDSVKSLISDFNENEVHFDGDVEPSKHSSDEDQGEKTVSTMAKRALKR